MEWGGFGAERSRPTLLASLETRTYGSRSAVKR
jgi:hypothetical protein